MRFFYGGVGGIFYGRNYFRVKLGFYILKFVFRYYGLKGKFCLIDLVGLCDLLVVIVVLLSREDCFYVYIRLILEYLILKIILVIGDFYF